MSGDNLLTLLPSNKKEIHLCLPAEQLARIAEFQAQNNYQAAHSLRLETQDRFVSSRCMKCLLVEMGGQGCSCLSFNGEILLSVDAAKKFFDSLECGEILPPAANALIFPSSPEPAS